jgi:hypothetical protein
MLLEARFLVKDILKITSKKQNSKIITFYFGVSYFSQYDNKNEDKTLFYFSDHLQDLALKKKVN